VIEALLEQKLTGGARLRYAAGALLSMLAGIAAVVVAAAEREPPLFPPIVWGIFGLAALGKGLLTARTAIKGRVDAKSDSRRIIAVSYYGSFVVLVLLLAVAAMHADSTRSVLLAVVGFGLVILTSLARLMERVNRAELDIREKLLEMQCHLAEMTKEMTKLFLQKPPNNKPS
jgi:Kef-type K+ transport system membrane component KefB